MEYGAVRRLPMRSEAELGGETRTPAQDGMAWSADQRVVWRRTLKRSPTGFRNPVGREPRVAAVAATRGYGRVPLQGTYRWESLAPG